MSKFRTFGPLVLAVLVAFLASFVVYRTLKHRSMPPTVMKEETVPVAVAASDLPWGTKLEGNMIEIAPYLPQSLPPGHFADRSALEGRVLITSLKKNEPITESRLAATSVTTGGVPAILGKGKRAVAVKGNPVLGVAGFIKPGNRVDVLVTVKDPKTGLETSKIVLQDILVLSAGQQLEKKGGEHEAAPSDVYTLEVRPSEAERLALAATQGTLHFALRGLTDNATVLTEGATVPETLASYRMEEPPAPPAAKPEVFVPVSEEPPVRRPVSVQVIKGTTVSQSDF